MKKGIIPESSFQLDLDYIILNFKKIEAKLQFENQSIVSNVDDGNV